MKVHAHLPPPLPTTLLPARASANQAALATASAKANTVGDGSVGAAAWQSFAAAALPVGSVSGPTANPLSTQRNASTARGYFASGQSSSPAPTATAAAQPGPQNEVDAGDLPYVRGSIVDIRA